MKYIMKCTLIGFFLVMSITNNASQASQKNEVATTGYDLKNIGEKSLMLGKEMKDILTLLSLSSFPRKIKMKVKLILRELVGQQGSGIINTADKEGRTMLHLLLSPVSNSLFAQSKTMLKYVIATLRCGANVNAKDKDGNTPLHYFLNYVFNDEKTGGPQEDHVALLKMLITFHADVTLRTSFVRDTSRNQNDCRGISADIVGAWLGKYYHQWYKAKDSSEVNAANKALIERYLHANQMYEILSGKSSKNNRPQVHL